MASLEQNQGRDNSRSSQLSNFSTSPDDINTLLIGASALGTGEALGHSKEETLAALSRTRRRNLPSQANTREQAQLFQKFAIIQDADGNPMPAEINSAKGGRPAVSVPNSEVQIRQDNGERDQSAIDPSFGRDTNKVTRWNDKTSSYEEVYLPDGVPTPDGMRDKAAMLDFGLKTVKKGQEVDTNKYGQAITDMNGNVVMRNTYDIENTSDTTAGQGWSTGGGRATADAFERVQQAVIDGKVSAEEAAPLLERLRRTGDPSYAKQVEARAGRTAVRDSGEAFSPVQRDRHDRQERERNLIASMSGPEPEHIQGALTSAKTNPEQGVATRALRAEAESRFQRRPQAVRLNNSDAMAIAESLGISPYVDAETGLEIDTSAPNRTQVNNPNSSQIVNAPQAVTDAAAWAASRQYSGEGDAVTQANITQATSDLARRTQAYAPGYRSTPATGLEDFATTIQRIIDRRQGQGKNFYLRNAETGKNQKVAPGIEPALQLLRMSEGEKNELANALLQQGLATEGRPQVSSNVNVSFGGMFGSEVPDLGRPRDTQAAAFGRIPDFDRDGEDVRDAQLPAIGSIRERSPETGLITAQEPKPTRQVMKGRTPDEAVAVYTEQRREKGQAVDPVYAEKIRRGNASLRADQASTEENVAIKRLIGKAAGGVDPRIASEAQFIKEQLAIKAPGFNYSAQPNESTGYEKQVRSLGITPDPSRVVNSRREAPAPKQASGGGGFMRESITNEINKRAGREKLRNRVGYGAIGAGSLAAIAAALSGGQQEQEPQYVR